MATRKKRPVLYEVYRPSTRPADPTWKPGPPAPPREADRPPPPDESESQAPARTGFSLASPTFATVARWHVTISAPTLAILIAAAVVLLAVAFSAGRRYGSLHPGAPGRSELAQDQDTGTDASALDAPVATIAGPAPGRSDEATGAEPGAAAAPPSTEPRAKPEPSAGAPARQVTLQKGYDYVIIQHFGKKREHEAALEAARYLQDNGIACATLPGADIRLIATEPFLIRQPDNAAAGRERQRADRLMQHIRELGKQFSKELAKQGRKGYTLSECYLFEIR